MTFPLVLGIVATLFTLAAALGSAIAILRSAALKQTIEVQEGTIKALEKAREVDRDQSVRVERECAERISKLEGRAVGLEGLVAHNIADAVARTVLDALDTGRVAPRRLGT